MDPNGPEVKAAAERLRNRYTERDLRCLLAALIDAYNGCFDEADRRGNDPSVAGIRHVLRQLNGPVCGLATAKLRLTPLAPPQPTVVGSLTRGELKQLFEYFGGTPGREVLLLGPAAEIRMHWLRQGAERQMCQWQNQWGCGHCAKALDPSLPKGETAPWTRVYFAPAMVRVGETGPYRQRVAVLSDRLYRRLGKIRGGPARGTWFGIRRQDGGRKIKLVAKRQMPKGFPAAIPPAFDVMPFVQAKYLKSDNLTQRYPLIPNLRVEG